MVDKNINRQPVVKLLGVVAHGILGRRDAPPGYATGVIGLFCIILQFDDVPVRWMQVAGGHWVRMMERNRAQAFVLHAFWRAIGRSCGRGRITRRIATEMVMALCLLPLAFTDLRLRTDSTVAATDASGRAGGISSSVRLMARGALAWAQRGGFQRCSEEFAIWSWFDGVAALRQGWE